MQAFAGRLLLAQIVYDINISGIGLTAAGGLHAITADIDDPDRLIFLDENGDRDYTILKMSVQVRAKLWDIPTKFGLDFAFNTEDYKDTSAGSFTEFHRDKVSAYALSVIFGESKEPWDWQAGYSYAYIEMFAVNNSFAQDDGCVGEPPSKYEIRTSKDTCFLVSSNFPGSSLLLREFI